MELNRVAKLLFVVIVWLIPLLRTTAGETIWQIGKFDESSAEFSHWRDAVTGRPKGVYADSKQRALFVIGQSNAEDWYAYQPGSANLATGARPYPFTVQFTLRNLPAGSFELILALLSYSPRLPRLDVDLNGHRGSVYQRPRLCYSAGDHAVFYLPHYSKAEIRCPIPSSLLRLGTNILTLTAMDEGSEPEAARPSGFPWPGNSGIVYDALALERTDEAPGAPGAMAVPTIYFRERDGQLRELVDLFVRLSRPAGEGSVTLAVGSNVFTARLDGTRSFGEQRFTFEIPEFGPKTRGDITVAEDGRTHHFPVELSPARKWHLLIVPNEHMDVGYTDLVPKVAELHSRTLDDAMDLIDRHPEFRFNIEGFWVLEQFLRGRSAAERERLKQKIAGGKILVPASYGSLFTGFAALETLVRSHYPSKRYLAESGGRFDHAVNTDVPSYSWSYASVLAAAGIKYFAAASDAYRAPFLLLNRLHERSPHWWEGPDGGRVLVWYSRHYHQVASLFGLPPSLALGRESLPRFLQAYDRPEYQSDAVIIYGTQVENVALAPEQAMLARRWNGSYAFPKLEYAGFAEAIARIADQQEAALPVIRGDGGPYWEDGLGANARITALTRANERRAASAEKFATISSLLNPSVRPDLAALEELWRHLFVIQEHTWHADSSVRDPDSGRTQRLGAAKDANATDAERLIENVLGRSLSAISHALDVPAGTLILFNPSSWPRSGLVDVETRNGTALADPETGQTLPMEVLRAGPVFQRVRFMAPRIPALGFRVLRLLSGDAAALPPESSRTNVLENDYYRVVLDERRGAVARIYDKELQRELVDAASPFALNQFLYVTGADKLPNRLVQYSTVAPKPALQTHPAGEGRVLSIVRTGFATIARIECAATNAPRITTEIVLFDREKKILFINRVSKLSTYAKEAAYFAFPFAMAEPQFRYATQSGFVDPAKDLLPGASREWFAIQDWVSLSAPGLAVTLVPVDAPLITIGDIARGEWPAEFGRRRGTIFSYVMNNYTPEGYSAGQGGDFTFRFALTSGAEWDPLGAGRFGVEETTPLEVNEITANDRIDSPRARIQPWQTGWMTLEPGNVMLVTWKAAEDGRGTILRFVETAGRASEIAFSTPLIDLESAWLCNAVEDDDRPLTVANGTLSFPTRPFAITTVRLAGRPSSSRALR